jgi:uncharacterized protein
LSSTFDKPSILLANSPDRVPRVLIAALSGRALADAARRAGYSPLVADLFGDEDLRTAATISVRTAGDLESGLDGRALRVSLAQLAAGQGCEGLVWGAGFEDRPEVLARLARTWPILGNGVDVVKRAKNPLQLATLCAAIGVAHPEIRETRPADPANWLRKTIGGSGGTHVQMARDATNPSGGTYYQRKVAGRAVSVLFLANCDGALVLGFTDQWSNPTRQTPLRYGGAVRPADITPGQKRVLRRIVDRVCRALGLRGLNSADFLVEDESLWLIEINPRPGATLDLFDSASAPLLAMHIEACRGCLPVRAPRYSGAAAAALVYAKRRIPVFPAFRWPQWTADWQRAGTCVNAGAPICTVRATERSASLAKASVEERVCAIQALVHGEQI